MDSHFIRLDPRQFSLNHDFIRFNPTLQTREYFQFISISHPPQNRVYRIQ